MLFIETDLYRFGCPGIAWLGQTHEREYEAYEASSPRDAWRLGQQRWLHWGKEAHSSGEYVVVLERKVLAPAVLKLSGEDGTLNRMDKRPHQELWVRVAVGEADTGWTGERNGGIFRHYAFDRESNKHTHQAILDPNLDLWEVLLPILGEDDPSPWVQLRQKIDEALRTRENNMYKYPKSNTPLWVVFTREKDGGTEVIEMLFEADNFTQLRAEMTHTECPRA